MKCPEVTQLLVAYLDNELTLYERASVQKHLERCEACQQELAALAALRSRVSRFLRVRAAQAVPSPQAWSCLQEKLARQASPLLPWFPASLQCLTQNIGRIHQTLTGGAKMMKRGLAFTILVAVLVALAAVAFVPSVRAQVGDLLPFRWFRFGGPGGGVEVSVPGVVEFTPLRPAYLPEGFQAMAVGLNPEVASLNYWNSATNQILMIDQQLVSTKSLPSGTKVTVKGEPAVLITGLEGSVAFVSLPPTPAAPTRPDQDEPRPAQETSPLEPVTASSAETISYTDGKQLIWYVGNVRVSILSNLPVEEMLKVAESMVPAEVEPHHP
ncbi:MAG: zf-HC2 domain-containing protein [Anaerolineae bacterium]